MVAYLRLARVEVGLDEDLADAHVLAHGPQGGLHGLSRPQDRYAGDLRRETGRRRRERGDRKHEDTLGRVTSLTPFPS